MVSTLTGALSSPDEPEGFDRSDFDVSIIFYRGRIGLRTGTAPINLSDSSRRMWSIHQPTKCSNRWFRFTGYRAAKQQDSDLAPDSRRAPSGVYVHSQVWRMMAGGENAFIEQEMRIFNLCFTPALTFYPLLTERK
jgi:hypothetical protein